MVYQYINSTKVYTFYKTHMRLTLCRLCNCELRRVTLMSILRPLLKVVLFAMRMHVGVGLERFGTIRTCVQIDTGVRCHVLLRNIILWYIHIIFNNIKLIEPTLSPIGFLNAFSQMVHLCFASLCTYRICIPRACRFDVCLSHNVQRTWVSVCLRMCNRSPRSFFSLVTIDRCAYYYIYKCV